MIDVRNFYNALIDNGVEFFAGVPDSLLKDICSYITDETPSNKNFITANEGAAIALAAGYNIATGKVPLVYMQNSGLGNAVNPILSLADKEVYGIPMLLMIGWRGEPGIKDEPQHIKQGRVQNALLDAMEIPYYVLDSDSTDYANLIEEVCKLTVKRQAPAAIIIKKNTFNDYCLKKEINPKFEMSRETAIETLLSKLPVDSIIVSTTGKSSREVFEYRVRNLQNNNRDFLTVGSMGHCSQIALGIALNTNQKVFCLDVDCSFIMHMGSMGIVGKNAPNNFYHILLNNGSHESVGGQPTVGYDIDFPGIALSCGYNKAISVSSKSEFEVEIDNVLRYDGPVLLEIKVNKSSRNNLGRPSSTPIENKKALIDFIKTR